MTTPLRAAGAFSVLLAAVVGVSACGSTTEATSTTASSPSSMTESMPTAPMTAGATGTTAAKAGRYITQQQYEPHTADYAKGKVVLFFAASWCPDCQATDKALTSTGVPEGLTVVKVDYDTATDLKQKYGVTQQHTFVQVDPMGMKLAAWSGSTDGAAIQAKTV